MGLRSFDTSGYMTTLSAYPGIFAGNVTWACWVQFYAGTTAADEFIFGEASTRWNFSRRFSDNMIYAHCTTNGSSHTFQNATFSSNNVWYHLIGAWASGSSLRLYLNGTLQGTAGTGQVNNGDGNSISFNNDGSVEIAHCAVWQGTFTDAEYAVCYRSDPREFYPSRLRGYWPWVCDPDLIKSTWLAGVRGNETQRIGGSGYHPIETTNTPPLLSSLHHVSPINPALLKRPGQVPRIGVVFNGRS